MTGRISTEFDISAYAGKYVTLKFSAAQASDTSYPTLVLIDNIHTDMRCSFSSFFHISYIDILIQNEYNK